ncbi:MAG: ATP-binding protein [Desulfamplus sp.]|nr:ATP-binding protein [Desulfamplus sp.]
MKKLPLGIQNFDKLRKDNYLYIDKTEYALKLINEGTYYFLSRPRRFGKSLFLDTLKCLFEGTKQLFDGLYVYEKWDWNIKYPVIKISFGAGIAKDTKKLTEMINFNLRESETANGVEAFDKSNYGTYFNSLIISCYDKYKTPVVILIDEYDKPILDNLTDESKALEMRNNLRDLYSVIKDSDKYIKFAFLTGVSKFSKMNLFSGLNNLTDITIDDRYAAICGYTQNDVETVFKEYLQGVDMEELKRWYNGYSFGNPSNESGESAGTLGVESVYNPYDILLFFDKGKQFKSWWFETGTPTFLIDMIREKHYHLPDLENIEVSEQVINTFDVGNIPIESLMFQTGYLTIKAIKPSRIPHIKRYCLGFPNFEVRYSFLSYFIDHLAESYISRGINQDELYGALEELKIEKLESVLKTLFSSIPYTAYVKNDIANYEGFYLSVVYAYFYSLGIDITLEDVSSKGRADMVIKFPANTVYILEFKVVEDDKSNTKKPLEQIKEKRYFEKYAGVVDKIFIIGVEFSKVQRNVVSFEWEQLN